MAFLIEEKTGRRRSDAEVYSSAKKSNTKLKPMKTGTRATLGLSIRWTSDVVLQENGKRSLIRVVLLNHALLCASTNLGGDFFVLDWMAPLARITLKEIDRPVE